MRVFMLGLQKIAIALTILSFQQQAFGSLNYCNYIFKGKSDRSGHVDFQNQPNQSSAKFAQKKRPPSKTGFPTLPEMIADSMRLPGNVERPGFRTFGADQKASLTWTGVEGPKLFQSMLPPGVRFIDHAVMGAMEDGVVKSSNPGRAVHVRLVMKDENGVDRSTNAVVPVQALIDNLSRPEDQRSLVPIDSKGVYMAMHGGGTKGTSHAVKINILNYLSAWGVAVVGWDLTGHAEGDRAEVQTKDQFLKPVQMIHANYIRPSGVQGVALGGHSWGAMIVDQYMRTYPASESNPIKMGISLSPAIDALPGSSPLEKLQIDARLDKENIDNPNTNPDEANLGMMLLGNGKVSAICGLVCDFSGFWTDWTLPKNYGANLIPIHYLWGGHDPLLVDRENYRRGIVDSYLRPLKNATVQIIDGPRRTLQDRDGTKTELPGHLFFDHRPWVHVDPSVPESLVKKLFGSEKLNAEDTARLQKFKAQGLIKMEDGVEISDLRDPEVFVKIRLMFEKMLGEKLVSTEKDKLTIGQVIQMWANNLAFRKYFESYVHQILLPTEANAELGRRSLQISQQIKELQDQKNHSPEEMAMLKALRDEGVAIGKRFQAERSGVKDPSRRAEMALLDELIQARSSEISNLISQMTAVNQQAIGKSGIINRTQKQIEEQQLRIASPKFNAAVLRREKAFKMVVARDQRVRDLGYGHLLKNFNNGSFAPNIFTGMPKEAIDAMEKFANSMSYYSEQKSKVKELMMIELASADLKLKQSADSNSADIESIRKTLVSLNGALADMKKDFANMESNYVANSARLSQLFQAKLELQKRRAELFDSPLFRIEFLTMEQMLDRLPPEDARLMTNPIAKGIEAAYAEWLRIWNTRVIGESENSAY